MMKPGALNLLWANVVERVKDRVSNLPLWEALEHCKPIAIDGSVLVLGLDVADYRLASHLQQTAHMHAISQAVQELFGQPLQVRIIEGVTPQDWEATKNRDARVAAMKQATSARRFTEDAEVVGWDGVYEYIARLYAETPLRALPQGKARYANDALYALAEAMDTLYQEPADDVGERSLARVLERIANMADVPAPFLAFELERLRAWRKASAEEGGEAQNQSEEEAASAE